MKVTDSALEGLMMIIMIVLIITKNVGENMYEFNHESLYS